MDALRDRMDAKFHAVNAAIGGMKDSIDSIRAELAAAKIRALLRYFALAAGMLGTMARGFGWL